MAAAHAPGGEGASSCSEDGPLEDEDSDEEDSDREEDGDGGGDGYGDGDGGGGGGSDGESSVEPIVRATRSRSGSRR